MSIDKSINNTLPTTSCKNSDWNVNSQTSFNLDNHTNVLMLRFSQQQKKEKKKKKIGLHSKIRVVSVWVMMPESLRTMSEPKRDRQLDTSGRNTYRTDKENQVIMG